MTDRLELELREWLDERGAVDQATVDSVRAGIGTLPARRRGPANRWLFAAAIGILLVVVRSSRPPAWRSVVRRETRTTGSGRLRRLSPG